MVDSHTAVPFFNISHRIIHKEPMVIREILPYCGGQVLEHAVSMYRMWHCFDCGLEFTMKTRETPRLCPRCTKEYEYPATVGE